ncbi:MAG: CDGSH iron-sulfur domain-containing protein [Thermoanaerobaculia bacterium]
MPSKIHRYEGAALTVLYDARRCIHAAECVRGLPAVFDSQRRPWVAPDAAAADALAEVVRRCPSGALHYERKDGGFAEAAPENRVEVSPDGPLYLQGQVEIAPPHGAILYADTRTALCRCGASQNKPFCDGSHVRVGFHDPGVWNGASVEPAPRDGSPLHVVCCPDGPLVLQGQFELEAGDGRPAPLRRRAFCRCGASSEKPFCDGSHARIGFSTEDPE